VVSLLYGPLCRGLLGGRVRADTRFPGDDLRNVDPKFRPPRYPAYLAAAARLADLAARLGHTLPELAVRWVLDQPGAGVALWGARRPEQLAPVAGVWGWRVPEEAQAEIDAILAAIGPPIGPEFMAPP
jgi:aryl-alcohol dehydrogenase-like predicted oxidoreductase